MVLPVGLIPHRTTALNRQIVTTTNSRMTFLRRKFRVSFNLRHTRGARSRVHLTISRNTRRIINTKVRSFSLSSKRLPVMANSRSQRRMMHHQQRTNSHSITRPNQNSFTSTWRDRIRVVRRALSTKSRTTPNLNRTSLTHNTLRRFCP